MAVSVKVWWAFGSNHSTTFSIIAEFEKVEEAREVERRLKREIGTECIGGFLVEAPTIVRAEKNVVIQGDHEVGCKAKIVEAIMEYISEISRPLKIHCVEPKVE